MKFYGLPLADIIEGKIIFIDAVNQKIKIANNEKQYIGTVTKKLLKKAQLKKDSEIKALFISTEKKKRFLWIKDIDEPICTKNAEERIEYIFKKWDNLLRRLS